MKSSHCGIAGNEEAQELIKKCEELPQIGKNISHNKAKMQIKA